jgi:hypothetical protein
MFLVLSSPAAATPLDVTERREQIADHTTEINNAVDTRGYGALDPGPARPS